VSPARTAAPSPYDSVPCPLSGCGADLYVHHSADIPILRGSSVDDLADPTAAITQTWEVGCTEGHVILLPVDDGEDSHRFGTYEAEEAEPVELEYDDVERLARLTGWEAERVDPTIDLNDLAAHTIREGTVAYTIRETLETEFRTWFTGRELARILGVTSEVAPEVGRALAREQLLRPAEAFRPEVAQLAPRTKYSGLRPDPTRLSSRPGPRRGSSSQRTGSPTT